MVQVTVCDVSLMRMDADHLAFVAAFRGIFWRIVNGLLRPTLTARQDRWSTAWTTIQAGLVDARDKGGLEATGEEPVKH